MISSLAKMFKIEKCNSTKLALRWLFVLGFFAISIDVCAQDSQVPNSTPKILEPKVVDENLTRQPKINSTAQKRSNNTSVQVDQLTGIDIEAVGLLDINEGGFGFHMWKGVERATVESLLSNLPTNTDSFAMQNLMRRLLLSRAKTPAGKGGSSLLALRAKLLLALGNTSEVQKLIDLIPSGKREKEISRIEADTRFLVHDSARACEIAFGQIEAKMELYWQNALIFCQILSGDTSKASLGISLMRELGHDVSLINQLVDSVISKEAIVLESFSNPTPIELALARIAQTKLPEDVLSTSNSAILRAIAVSPNAEPMLRIDAAERARASNALDVDVLRQIYTSAEFNADERQYPLTYALEKEGVLGRALLFQTALSQKAALAKVETIAKALDLARREGRYLSVVFAFRPFLDSVSPSSEMLWFAPEALRAYLSLRDPNGVNTWFSILRASALFHEDSNDLLRRIRPLGRLIKVDDFNQNLGEILSDWWQSIAPENHATQRATLIFSLFEALGEKVPNSLWASFIPSTEFTAQPGPHPALEFRLLAAMKRLYDLNKNTTNVSNQNSLKSSNLNDNGKRALDTFGSTFMGRGEVILLCLLLLGEGGPSQATPGILYKVISSLKAVGLEFEARSIALEAALAKGF